MSADESIIHQDWHPADVLAALKKRGKTLSGLSVAHGYHATAAGKALKHPWPAMEALIAAAIGMRPEDIWPTRYVRKPQATMRKKAPSVRKKPDAASCL